MRGVVSCFALQPESGTAGAGSMLAAGAWTRWVSLYDGEGMGGTVANFSVADAADTEAKIGGAGVSQLLWSDCGTYLYVVERRSNGILMYDVRSTNKSVSWLEGRDADTNQRMAVDLTTINGKAEIWAGGTNGSVKCWKDAGSKEGAHVFDDSWQAYGEQTAVGGMSMHNCGSIIATASGSRRELAVELGSDSGSDSDDDDDGDDDKPEESQASRASPCNTLNDRTKKSKPEIREDNSIKIWSLT